MSIPYASIAMPFFNAERYLPQALKSILRQSHPDWELILIDDGSQDDSATVAGRLDDPRIRYYADGQNRKLNERLNQSIQLARGKFFFRMDADDLMHPLRIERQLQKLENSPKDTVIGTAAYSIDANSRAVGIRRVPKRQYTGFQARHSFIHPTVAGHTAWFRKHLYSTNFLFHRSQDAELWCRTSQTSNFEWLDEPLLFYREQGTFKLSNYLGTQMGILQMATDLNAPLYQRAWHLWRECIKLGIVSTLAMAGKTDMVVRGRYSKLDEAERKAADAVINEILRSELPNSASARPESYSNHD